MPVTPNSIVTPQTPYSAVAVATAAEVAFQAPTQTVTLVPEAENVNGLRLTSLYAINRAATAALNCALYLKVGAVYTLLDSALMAANTPSATVPNAKADFGYSDTNPLVLKPGVGLAVSIGTTIANGVTFKAHGGAY